MNFYTYNYSYNGKIIPVSVLRTNRDMSDAYISIGYEANSVKNIAEFVNSAPAVDGCEIYAAFNGGPFNYMTDKYPQHLLVKNGVRLANASDFTSLKDLAIKNCSLSIVDHLTDENSTYYDFARGGFLMSFVKNSSGGYVVDGGTSDSAYRTLVGVNASYILFISILTNVTTNDICYVLQQLGCDRAVNMDGGQSTAYLVGDDMHFSTRKVSDAILIYKKKNYFINTTRDTLRVRTSPSTGATPIATIPVNSCAKILSFLGIQSDGFQWVRVSYNGQTGYCQLDSTYYTVSGGLGNSVKTYLNTTRLQVVVRGSVVNGPILTRIPVGNRAEILEYLPGLQSDGYQWARVKYGNVTGYAQIDTYNCYTISF